MTQELKWQERILTEKNPFKGNIVRNPWEEFSDVKSINQNLTEQVLNFLKEVKGGKL